MGPLLKMRRFKGECAHFSFNKCPRYIHDGASVKFSSNSHETDYSVGVFSTHNLGRRHLQFLQFLHQESILQRNWFITRIQFPGIDAWVPLKLKNTVSGVLKSKKIRARTTYGFKDNNFKCRLFWCRLYLVQLLIGEKETLFCLLQILLQPLYTPENMDSPQTEVKMHILFKEITKKLIFLLDQMLVTGKLLILLLCKTQDFFVLLDVFQNFSSFYKKQNSLNTFERMGINLLTMKGQ